MKFAIAAAVSQPPSLGLRPRRLRSSNARSAVPNSPTRATLSTRSTPRTGRTAMRACSAAVGRQDRNAAHSLGVDRIGDTQGNSFANSLDLKSLWPLKVGNTTTSTVTVVGRDGKSTAGPSPCSSRRPRRSRPSRHLRRLSRRGDQGGLKRPEHPLVGARAGQFGQGKLSRLAGPSKVIVLELT